jgi:type IX secretion system PorP/SprF family membrane protein
MKNIKIIIAVLAVFTTQALMAQQEPFNTMFAVNKLPVNPGYTGGKDALSIRAVYRDQWLDLPGNPRTIHINAHAPLFKESLALGFSVVNDQIGTTNNTSLTPSLAYRIFFKNDSRLSFGINAGIQIFKSKITELEAVDVNDPMLQNNLRGVRPQVGMGVYYYNTKYYVGISVPNVIPVKLTNFRTKEDDFRFQQLPSLLIMGGYTFEIGKKKNFWIQPQVLMKYMPSAKFKTPFEIDANLMFTFYKYVGVGLTYRSGIANPYQNRESIDVMALIHLPKDITIGYAYDHTISKLKTYNGGTHEIVIGYDLALRKKGIRTPRYF